MDTETYFKELQLLSLKKRPVMWDYQEILVTDIIKKFTLQKKTDIRKPYVLGACPGSGKTEMTIEGIIRLIKSGLVDRVLILAHSTNVLKENFYDRLSKYLNDEEIAIFLGQKDYNYNARIQVMIPQNISHVIGDFDLVVVDEGHHNVLVDDGNYSKIIEYLNQPLELFLTGSPSKFILRNDLAKSAGEELPYHINAVGMDMIGLEHFHNVKFDLVKSAYGFTNNDYNQNNDLLRKINFSFDDTERTMLNVIIGLVRNIALRNGVVLPRNSDFILEAKKLIQSGDFGKTLIMCKSINQAEQISKIISKLFEVKVRVSESKNDVDSSNLDKFKRNQFEFLCVVNRGREGYDDYKIVNLIDITMTHNIDLIYQMFCRLVRLDKENPNSKIYIKVTSIAEGMPEYTQAITTAALMLGATENLSRFNGRNFRGIAMPVISREPRENIESDDFDDIFVGGVVDVVDAGGNIVRRKRVSELLTIDLIQMFTQDEENLISGNDRYAMTTLGESLTLLMGNYISSEETFKICVENELTSNPKYKSYKNQNPQLNLYSTPWTSSKETCADYFNRVKYELGVGHLSPEDTFQICVDNELTNIPKYILYREQNLQLNLHSEPWEFYKESCNNYFNRVKDELGINYKFLSPEDTFQICVENELTSSPKYRLYREQNLQLNLYSSPWTSSKETSGDYFNRVKYELGVGHLPPEETFKICVENIIIGSHQYKLYRNQNPQLNLYSSPWNFNKESIGDYFNRVKDELGINYKFLSPEDTFQICVENELTSGPKYKLYREQNLQLNLHASPWTSSKETSGDYFNRVKYELGVGHLPPEETFKICVENKLIDRPKYRLYRKQKPQLNLVYEPWGFNKESVANYFNRVKDELKINYKFLSPEDTFQICVENELTSSPKYKLYREQNLQLNLHSEPWSFHKESISDYFNRVKYELGINYKFLSPEDTFQICVDNNLINRPKYRLYREQNLQLNLHSEPWSFRKEPVADYFNRVKDELGVGYLSPEETFQICVDNNLTISPEYRLFRKNNTSLKLRSQPWIFNKESIIDYFNRVKYEINKIVKTKKNRSASLSEFSKMNKAWNTTNSKNNHKRLNKDKAEWFNYHNHYAKAREKWNEIPYMVIAEKINVRPDWIIGDFGCGENLLSKEIKNTIHSFDHVAIDDSVKSCDITDVPLHNNVLDVVVFSLSLMGTNFKEYFEEAYRVLRPMGLVFIAEPATRWEDREGELKEMLELSGFKVTEIRHSDRFIYVDAIKY